jgi:hypothetical protein
MDNTETLPTLVKEDTGRRQTKHTNTTHGEQHKPPKIRG